MRKIGLTAQDILQHLPQQAPFRFVDKITEVNEDYIVGQYTFKADEFLLDDLNTPGFIARIHELYNDAREGDNEKKLKFNQACRMIGLFNVSKQDWDNLKKNRSIFQKVL